VTVFQGQMITQNMLASTATGGQFSILEPNETVGPIPRPGGPCR